MQTSHANAAATTTTAAPAAAPGRTRSRRSTPREDSNRQPSSHPVVARDARPLRSCPRPPPLFRGVVPAVAPPAPPPRVRWRVRWRGGGAARRGRVVPCPAPPPVGGGGLSLPPWCRSASPLRCRVRRRGARTTSRNASRTFCRKNRNAPRAVRAPRKSDCKSSPRPLRVPRVRTIRSVLAFFGIQVREANRPSSRPGPAAALIVSVRELAERHHGRSLRPPRGLRSAAAAAAAAPLRPHPRAHRAAAQSGSHPRARLKTAARAADSSSTPG